jgi:site-specific recombinase XerD
MTTGELVSLPCAGNSIPVPACIQQAGAAASFVWEEFFLGTIANPMSGVDIWRLVKCRLKAAELPMIFSPHSFRSCGATDLLSQGTPLEDVQYLLGHADARTTRLYDRRQKRVTRNIVERISV